MTRTPLLLEAKIAYIRVEPLPKEDLMPLPELSEAMARLELHAKMIKEGGAPHQKQHGADIEVVLGAAKSWVATSAVAAMAPRDSILERADQHVARLTAEIGKLRMELMNSNGEIRGERSKVADLEAEVKAARQLLANAEQELQAKAGLGIASTKGQTLADIKEHGLAGTTGGTGDFTGGGIPKG